MGLNQLINNFNENYKILDLDKLENQFKNNKVFTIINAYNYGKISIKKNKIIKRKQKILDLLLKKKKLFYINKNIKRAIFLKIYLYIKKICFFKYKFFNNIKISFSYFFKTDIQFELFKLSKLIQLKEENLNKFKNFILTEFGIEENPIKVLIALNKKKENLKIKKYNRFFLNLKKLKYLNKKIKFFIFIKILTNFLIYLKSINLNFNLNILEILSIKLKNLLNKTKLTLYNDIFLTRSKKKFIIIKKFIRKKQLWVA